MAQEFTHDYLEENYKNDEDLLKFAAEYEKRCKAHKRVRIGLLITSGLLIAGAFSVVLPVFGAMSAAFWAINGPLTTLGLIGLAATGISKFLDRKNKANMKFLEAEKQIRGLDGSNRDNEKALTQATKTMESKKSRKHVPTDIYGRAMKQNQPRCEEETREF